MIAKPLHLLLVVALLAVVVSIAATAATVTPIRAATVTIVADGVVVAAPIPLPQVVDDPERNLRAGSGIDIGGARKVEDEAAIAQVERRREAHHSCGKLTPGHLAFYAPGGVRPCPWRLRSRLRRRLGSRWQ